MRNREAYFRDVITGRSRGLTSALLRGGLRLLSHPYGWAMLLRNRAYDRGWKQVQRVPVPVVSVGNLTLGGTGKTPCVEYLARFYRQEGLQVALLSRGYGSERGRNDEAMVLEENLPDVPHLQGVDRVALAETAIEELESEILILDDGFQHRRLGRDLDLVLVDATDPWGQGYCFPGGFLREPLRGLRRADAVLLTRCDQEDPAQRQRLRQQLTRLAPGKPLIETTHAPVELVNAAATTGTPGLLQQHPIAGFCGLGNPEAFRRSLLQLGARLIDFRSYPDHHPYAREDVQGLIDWARQLPADCVIATTQKDLVKIRLTELADRPLWAVRIELRVESGRDDLERVLRGIVPQLG